jgi:hypothetical protein
VNIGADRLTLGLVFDTAVGLVPQRPFFLVSTEITGSPAVMNASDSSAT